MIVYYYSDFESTSDKEIARMMQWMPQQQVDLISRMKTLSRRREQAVSYAMLAYALQNDMADVFSSETIIRAIPSGIVDFVPQKPPEWRVAEHGKPYLTNYSDVYFNISHCREAIATAVSNAEVGIDIEGRRKFSQTLLQRAFNDREQALVAASSDPEAEFGRLWTRKEAWFKYTGTGILIEHLKTTEAEASKASCKIETYLVENKTKNPFNLSIAQKK